MSWVVRVGGGRRRREATTGELASSRTPFLPQRRLCLENAGWMPDHHSDGSSSVGPSSSSPQLYQGLQPVRCVESDQQHRRVREDASSHGLPPSLLCPSHPMRASVTILPRNPTRHRFQPARIDSYIDYEPSAVPAAASERPPQSDESSEGVESSRDGSSTPKPAGAPTSISVGVHRAAGACRVVGGVARGGGASVDMRFAQRRCPSRGRRR